MTETPLEFYKRARKHGDIPHLTMADYAEVWRESVEEVKAKQENCPGARGVYGGE